MLLFQKTPFKRLHTRYLRNARRAVWLTARLVGLTEAFRKREHIRFAIERPCSGITSIR